MSPCPHVPMFPCPHVLKLVFFAKVMFAYTCMTEALQCMQKMVPECSAVVSTSEGTAHLTCCQSSIRCNCWTQLQLSKEAENMAKNYMSQQRLNSCAVCNTHRTIVDAVDVRVICNEFISPNDIWLKLSGRTVLLLKVHFLFSRQCSDGSIISSKLDTDIVIYIIFLCMPIHANLAFLNICHALGS